MKGRKKAQMLTEMRCARREKIKRKGVLKMKRIENQGCFLSNREK